MRPFLWLLLPLLAASPLLAKPKVNVRIKVNDEIAKDRAQDSLSKGTGSSMSTTFYGTVFLVNVTVLSDNAEAVAKNNGQWCISGDIELDSATEYHGTLDGNNLTLEILQKNGKIKKQTYEILDHKWRKLSDMTLLLDLPPAPVDFRVLRGIKKMASAGFSRTGFRLSGLVATRSIVLELTPTG